MVLWLTKNEHVGHGERDDVANVTQDGKNVLPIFPEEQNNNESWYILLHSLIQDAWEIGVVFQVSRMVDTGVGNHLASARMDRTDPCARLTRQHYSQEADVHIRN